MTTPEHQESGQDEERVPTHELLPQVYDRTTFIPKEIHLPVPIEGDGALTDWLSERKGERVYLRLPARGPKAQRVGLARRNAEQAFRRRFRLTGAVDPALALAERLELAEPPRRVEGFDVSNFQGDQTVASLVVWEEGRMRKSDYRSFNIRGLSAPDDFESLRQAVSRRYRRRLNEFAHVSKLALTTDRPASLKNWSFVTPSTNSANARKIISSAIFSADSRV